MNNGEIDYDKLTLKELRFMGDQALSDMILAIKKIEDATRAQVEQIRELSDILNQKHETFGFKAEKQ